MTLFVFNLVNPGSNVIRRTSEQSSVTIPFEQTFRNVDNNRAEIATEAADIFNVCGCGKSSIFFYFFHGNIIPLLS